jgi:type II secretory pathway component GspD/PulD (secretin)
MRDGDVLVIGGVKQREVTKTTSKFPILGDIPLVSLLFKHTKTETLDRDLVIVVSPQIVRQMARSFPRNLPGEEREGGR